MTWLFLIPAMVLSAIGAWLSYAPWAKGTWYLFVVILLLAAGMAALWAWAISMMSKNAEIIAFSLAWDIGVLVIYCGFPLLVHGEKQTTRSWLALLLAVAAVVWFRLESGEGPAKKE